VSGEGQLRRRSLVSHSVATGGQPNTGKAMVILSPSDSIWFFRLFYRFYNFSDFNFFGLSTTDETLLVEMRIHLVHQNWYRISFTQNNWSFGVRVV
jgi:hypothetical protein